MNFDLGFIPYFFRKKDLRSDLRNNWGKHLSKERNFASISLLNTLSGGNEYSSNLVKDIELNEVFSRIDNCHTSIGQQCLYHLLLSQPKSDEYLSRLNCVNLFDENSEVRENSQLQLNRLKRHTSYNLPALFLGKKVIIQDKFIYYVLALAPIILLFLATQIKVLYFVFGAAVLVNMIIHYRNKNDIEFFISSVRQVRKMKGVALNLLKLDKNLNDPSIEVACRRLSEMLKYYYIVDSDRTSQNEYTSVLWLFIEYIKILFLIEVIALSRCSKSIKKLATEIEIVYHYIGKIDSSISISSFRSSLKYYCEPIFKEVSNCELEIEDLIHPLIEPCEPNNIRVTSRGMIITGSNMSGKTSFIKAVAINVILAQTIGTALARKYSASHFKIYTSIKIQDDISTGKSYYLSEALSLKKLVEASDNSEHNLFIIDEPFKGTNSLERSAAAVATLRYLQNSHCTVLVSTHDLEMTEGVDGYYDIFHFEETISSNDLVFTHKVFPGPLFDSNAIKLLKVLRYPEEILNSAMEYLKLRSR